MPLTVVFPETELSRYEYPAKKTFAGLIRLSIIDK
jgi:hypothetical protein